MFDKNEFVVFEGTVPAFRDSLNDAAKYGYELHSWKPGRYCIYAIFRKIKQ